MGRSWLNLVFGKHTRDWLKILTLARDEVEQFMSNFSMIPASSDRLLAFDDLELLCKNVYEQVLESGFRHREEISRFSLWEDVVRAMIPSQVWRRIAETKQFLPCSPICT
jgi:hypothetical protein